jgi:hypothetical protein
VFARTDDFNTPVSGDSLLKDFRGGDFHRASVSSNIFLTKEQVVFAVAFYSTTTNPFL